MACMSSAPSGPLESLRVLVVGDYLAAPVCGQFLSRLGASVTRIESPETGTLQRLADHGLIPPAAGAFGRCGLTVRPAAQLGASLGQLLRAHDALVPDLPGARLPERGLDPRRGQAQQPGKILVSTNDDGR